MYFQSSKSESTWFIWFLKGLIIFGFLIMIGRLLDLQVVRGTYYKSLAEDNRVRRIPILAMRGSIFARDGETIVSSQKKDESENGSSYKEAKDLVINWSRQYKGGSLFGHITGYLGYVREDEVGKSRANCTDRGTRKSGSFVGRTGLEEQYDCSLSGIDGEELVEVDAMGGRIRTLGRKEPVKGEDLRTTIDYGLQKKAAESMKDPETGKERKGAVVALNTNGEVLALYSSPSFDPSLFISKDKSQEVGKILTDPNLPLFNRAIGGLFHPGSIYKPIVALAALEEGVISKDYTYDDAGRITINTNYGNFIYNNWYYTQYGGKEGQIDVTRALARSTDTFFYEIGNLLGVDKIDEWSHLFGLDQKTGIDVPGEIPGLVPSPDWKKRVKNENWFLGNTYHMSIGQGDLSITPLAITSAISAIAANGEWCKPQIVGGTDCKKFPVNQENIKTVKTGMIKACETGGTAYPFFDFKLPNEDGKVACKTGTAQIDTGDDTHAWFTIFAPSENPEIVLTVLVEKGGEGSKVAAPIARELFNYWFYERKGLEVPKKANATSTPAVGE
jgi:penicillin-binding protein 2